MDPALQRSIDDSSPNGPLIVRGSDAGVPVTMVRASGNEKMKILWKFGSVNIWDFDYAYDHWLGIGFHKDSVCVCFLRVKKWFLVEMFARVPIVR